MAALQYVDEPGYRALLLRRTFSDLRLPEALMDRAASWLGSTKAHWINAEHTWLFPSGATLTFGYLQNEGSQNRYQSSAYQFIGLDELTQFTRRQYLFMFSRLRRAEGAAVPLRMRSASNPGGVGHDWVKARFVKPGKKGRPFIRASLADNPYIDQVAYEASLALLPPLEQAWYRYGDWDAQPGGEIAKREWFPVVEAAPALGRKVRMWDLAATERSAKSADPDWTVGLKMTEYEKVYYVEHVVRGRWGPGAVERVMRQTAEMDGRLVPVRIEQEPGGGSVLFIGSCIRELAGWDVSSSPARGDKVARAMPFIRQAEAGNVKLVRGAWNEAYLDEITRVPLAGHDDQWDTGAAGFNFLTSRTSRPARSHDG